jgi:hypothetical protein
VRDRRCDMFSPRVGRDNRLAGSARRAGSADLDCRMWRLACSGRRQDRAAVGRARGLSGSPAGFERRGPLLRPGRAGRFDAAGRRSDGLPGARRPRREPQDRDQPRRCPRRRLSQGQRHGLELRSARRPARGLLAGRWGELRPERSVRGRRAGHSPPRRDDPGADTRSRLELPRARARGTWRRPR